MSAAGITSKNWKAHLMLVAGGYIADQLTKLWAIKTFSHPTGEIDFQKVIPVIGQWLQLRLVYNAGAAFGLQPQKVIAFLHPTLFYGLISLIAITFLVFFYKKTPNEDLWTQLGICLIVAGAFGNITDRLRLHKVVDFIDADFPDFIMQRWPTFNLADSMVCVGVSIILIIPLFQKKKPA